ncbi:MAG: hypothetical protein V3R82_05685 [Candidatus Hydrothermarchaeales archaeon]
MSVSRLLRNAKFVDIALALTIGSLGFFINAIYFTPIQSESKVYQINNIQDN